MPIVGTSGLFQPGVGTSKSGQGSGFLAHAVTHALDRDLLDRFIALAKRDYATMSWMVCDD